ncbi:MAG TPA: MmcQ/YjbR family DNA-binding protein [Candidatus Koribacter sp.]|jgi:hypothetical protein
MAHPLKPSTPKSEKQIKRLRKVCLALPETTEKLSHGEPTFFVNKKVFAMFDNNHHNTGHIAVWIPARAGIQEILIEEAPDVYFRPPYVGVKGWVGIELASIQDEPLAAHIREAWKMIAPKRLTVSQSI